jgi:hypothetical protein
MCTSKANLKTPNLKEQSPVAAQFAISPTKLFGKLPVTRTRT